MKTLIESAHRSLSVLLFTAALFACSEPQQPVVEMSEPQPVPSEKGEHMMYVPAYSYVTGAARRRVILVTTLTIHNVSPQGRVTLRSVEYHAPLGAHITSYVGSPQILEPLETAEFIVDKVDNASGIGCNFVVTYDLEDGAAPPLIEAVMVGQSGTGVLSVTSRGIPVDSPPK